MISKKYPRSLHVPFSPGASSDDKIMSEAQFEYFLGKEKVITEKLDGSNVCLTRESCFSRSHSGPPAHKSFDFLKSEHNRLKYRIPTEFSFFAEYVFAVHSVRYVMLQNYINVFAIRNDKSGEWLSWDDVCAWSAELELPTVPILLRGTFFDKKSLQSVIENFAQLSSVYGKEREGVVIRTVEPTYVNEVNQIIGLGKWVRENHVTSDIHWEKKPIEVQPCITNMKKN